MEPQRRAGEATKLQPAYPKRHASTPGFEAWGGKRLTQGSAP